MKRFICLLFVLGSLIIACTAQTTTPATDDSPSTTKSSTGQRGGETGSLSIVANGEDFVRQGFVSKDGWRIDFDHVYVTLADVTAYQIDSPYDAESGDMPEGTMITVEGPLTLDLAAGDEDAGPILIATIDAVAGQYRALGWRMVPAAEGDLAGATISLVGTVQKDGETIDFIINDATEYVYNCGEFVGDERKGIVQAGATADIEATFHFDHVFGDADTPAADALNVGALGFDPLAALAKDGTLNTTVAELEGLLAEDKYSALVETLATLGHVGEGHCYEATGAYTRRSK